MRLNQSKIAQIFFNPETLLPFLFGSVFLAVVGNAVTQILFKTFGDSAQSATSIALGAVLIFVVSILFFARALERQIKVEPNPRSPKKASRTDFAGQQTNSLSHRNPLPPT